MDIKSILRTFRYAELQQKAESDPQARRPPTIKFLGIFLAAGLLVFAFAILLTSYTPSDVGAGSPLEVDDGGDEPAVNTTATPDPDPSQGPTRVAGLPIRLPWSRDF